MDDLTTVDPPATEFSTTRGRGRAGLRRDRDVLQRDQFADPAGRRVVLQPGPAKLLPQHRRHRPGAAQRHRDPEPGGQRLVQDHCRLGDPAGRDRHPADRTARPGCFTQIEVPAALDRQRRSPGGLKTTASAPNSFPPALSFGQTFVSPAAVNNGAWHQAVLIPGQALYLDGQLVGSGTTSLTLPTGDVRAARYGPAAHSSCGSGCSSSATGRTSTAPWRTCRSTRTSCPASGTVAAQYAAETHSAAELTSVTSPGGRTELSATYDTVNDRVATSPTPTAGPGPTAARCAHRRRPATTARCWRSSPEDFWPLNDTAGPLAADVVGSAATAATPRPPATYSQRDAGRGRADRVRRRHRGHLQRDQLAGQPSPAGTSPAPARSRPSCGSRPPGGTLLSSGSGYRRRADVVCGSPRDAGCLEGTIGSTTLNAPLFGTCTGTRSTTASGTRRS